MNINNPVFGDELLGNLESDIYVSAPSAVVKKRVKTYQVRSHLRQTDHGLSVPSTVHTVDHDLQ